MKIIKGYGRLGFDDRSCAVWISDLDLDHQVANEILRVLGQDRETVHRETCGIIARDRKSITGDQYLSRKVIQFHIELNVKAELIDDKEAAQ